MTPLPAAVQAALAEKLGQSETPTADRIQSRRVAVGDIRIVQGLSHVPADPRIGLVLTVDGDSEYAEVLLTHTAHEFACDSDVVVPKTVAATPYDVVVQRDLRAVVWTWQLGAAVGWLDATALRALKTMSGGADDARGPWVDGPRSTGLRTGLPLAGPSDARWPFKQSEGEALRRLAEDCTNALLDRGLVWQVDPGMLRPELLDRAEAPGDLLEELLHWAMTRTLTITDGDLLTLEEAGVLTVEAWDSLSDLGSDLWTSLQDVVLAAATGVTGGAFGRTRRLVTASHLALLDHTTYEDVHVLGRQQAVRS